MTQIFFVVLSIIFCVFSHCAVFAQQSDYKVEWKKYYKSPRQNVNASYGPRIIVSCPNGFFLGGEMENKRLVVARFDSNGDTLWQTIVNRIGPPDDVFKFPDTTDHVRLIFTEGDVIRLVGYEMRHWVAPTGLWARWTVEAISGKILSEDHTPTTASYVLPGMYAIARTKNGGYIASNENSVNYENPSYLRLMDSLGSPLWQIFFHEGANVNTSIASVFETKDGGFLVFGDDSDFPKTTKPPLAFLMKTDSVGKVLWEKQYKFSPSSQTIAMNAKELPDASIVMLMSAPIGVQSCALLVKTTAEGETLWQKEICHEEKSVTRFEDIMLLRNGGFVLSGFVADSYGNDSTYDSFVVITDSIGAIQQKIFLGDTQKKLRNRVWTSLEMNDGTLLLAGDDNRSMYIAKFSKEATSVIEKSVDERALSVFPNPTDGKIMIRAIRGSRVKIVNAFGKEVADVSEQILKQDFAEVELDVSQVYFIIARNAARTTIEKVLMYR